MVCCTTHTLGLLHNTHMTWSPAQHTHDTVSCTTHTWHSLLYNTHMTLSPAQHTNMTQSPAQHTHDIVSHTTHSLLYNTHMTLSPAQHTNMTVSCTTHMTLSPAQHAYDMVSCTTHTHDTDSCTTYTHHSNSLLHNTSKRLSKLNQYSYESHSKKQNKKSSFVYSDKAVVHNKLHQSLCSPYWLQQSQFWPLHISCSHTQTGITGAVAKLSEKASTNSEA